MTVSNQNNSVTYVTNGTYTFPFSFPIPDAASLIVSRVDSGVGTILPSGQFSVTGLGTDIGGTVTYPLSGPALDSPDTLIVIQRKVPYTQPVNIDRQSGFFPEVIESQLDRMTMMIQQLAADGGQTLALGPAGGAYEADGNRITGLGAPVTGTDAVRLTDLQSATIAAGNVPAPTAGQIGQVLTATATGTFGWAAGGGGIDVDALLTKAGNLSGLANATTSLTNLGGTATGRALFTAADAAAARGTLGATAAGAVLFMAADAAAQRGALGLGSAAVLNAGAAANNVVQLDGSARLPAVDGSQLTGISAGGKFVDRAYAEYTTFTRLSAVTPFDDSVPQSSEGTQILSASITPKSVTNRLRCRAVIPLSGGANPHVACALFVNSEASARACSWATPTQVYGSQSIIEFEYVPGVTTAQVISIRVGPHASVVDINGAFNDIGASRRYGGALRASLVIEEIAP